MMLKKILSITLVMLVLGCVKVKESDLPGLYVSSFKDIEEILEINSDGTYYHSFVDKEWGLVEDRGKWLTYGFDDGFGEPTHVEFEGNSTPPFPESPFENKRIIRKNKGAVPDVSKTVTGSVILTFNDDNGYFFIKR